MTARDRLQAWRGDRSQKAAAIELGVTQALVSAIERGDKTPGLATALAIEAATMDWSDGPILPAEWVAADPAETATDQEGAG